MITPVRSAAGRKAPGLSWATLVADPNDLLDRYHIDSCLLSRSAPLVRVMRYLPGWRELYSDSKSVIFVRAL